MLVEGRNGFFTNELLGEIGKKYGWTIPRDHEDVQGLEI